MLLKQTVHAPFDPEPLLINGPNVAFSLARQLFWDDGKADTPVPEMCFGTWDHDGDDTRLIFTYGDEGINLDRVTFRDQRVGGRQRTLREGMSRSQVLRTVPKTVVEPFVKYRSVNLGTVRRKSFIDLALLPKLPKGVEAEGLLIGGPSQVLEGVVTDLIHVPGLRDAPLRYYPAPPFSDDFPGVFQNYLGSLLAGWTDTRDPRLLQLEEQLGFLGLTRRLRARRIDDTRVSLDVGRLQRRGRSADLVNIADVGLGLSQTLPVVSALLTARAGQWVFLEQPEIHLHPRAQVRLGQILAEAALRGVRVIAETHSALLLKSVQYVVASGALAPEKVVLHWAGRDQNGATTVTSSHLDRNGTFGDWPTDFGQVEMAIEEDFIEAAFGEMV